MATKQSQPAKQTQASKRLLKKISALRATLPADERKVLDSLMVTEVQAHRLTDKKPAARAGATRPSARANPGTKDETREVEAHRLHTKNTPGKTSPNRSDTEEVKAHQLKGRAQPGKLTGTKDEAREVEAHQLKGRAIPGKMTGSKFDTKEVSAHRLNTRTTTNRLSGGKADADEVRAHIAKPRVAVQKASTTKIIYFDKDSQEYRLQD
jgi:hypothetical protein